MADTPSNDEPKLTAVEGLKERSLGLYGDIAADVASSAPCFSDDSTQLLKHHGTYQQDNRDTRTERKKAGLDKDYRMMLRTKFPGGAISAEQYLVCDDLCTKYGQDDLRVTSRQCFQFHGVVKGNLRGLIHDLNHLASITSLGACGDVVRNTMAPAVADIDLKYKAYQADLQALARAISDHFLPRTTSYFDIWLDDEKVEIHPDGSIVYTDRFKPKQVEDPIYGTHYLPRKFKIGIATDFDNSVDVFTNDGGVIAVTDGGRIVGYEVLAGGGLGYTHRKEETYARLASPIAFVQHDEVVPILEAIVKVQRDFGGRTDRRQARLKYLIDKIGVDAFREKVYEYAGRTFDLPRGIVPAEQPDYLGWHKQFQDGLNYVGLWIENGRIRDFEGSYQFKSGIRRIVETYKPSVRLTPHHNLVLAGIRDEDIDAVQAILDEHRIPTDKGVTTIRRKEMACPALPLCGLAMAEAERAIAAVMEEIEAGGHGGDDILIRMSGCPNNCSRPRSAEIGIVGSGSDRYILYTGGHPLGLRLNEPIIEKVTAADLSRYINRLIDAWKIERADGENFGDWSHRIGVEAVREKLGAAVG